MLTAVIILGVLVFLLMGAVVWLLVVVHDIDRNYVTYKHLNIRYDELKAIYECLEDFIKETGVVLAKDIDSLRTLVHDETLLNKACRETVMGLLKERDCRVSKKSNDVKKENK